MKIIWETKMEIQVKKAIKAGNSSAVILPRAWLGREVRIELIKKSPEKILKEVIEIVEKYIELKEIIGIYLTGSYARGEEDKNSDIDLLIITKDSDKEIIKEGIYNILIISEELLKQKLESDLLPVGPMIKEAKALLNLKYFNSIEVRATKKNTKLYLDTTEYKLRMIKEIIDKMKKKGKKYLNDRVAYTLVLRIRTLEIIKNLIENKRYSKKEFIKKIRKIAGINAYERYLAVKNNLEEKNGISIDETEKLYEHLKRQMEEIKIP